VASVKAENVVKVFGKRRPVRALDGLSLEVNEGEIFGLLGPNGSGKTTFVKCCLNIIFPNSGEIKINGLNPGNPRVNREIGYLPENPNFYDYLSGRDFLYYHAELAGVPLRERSSRVDELLDYVKLDKKAQRRRLRTYSKGMLQRVGLAQALVNKPRLIFLDEPQTGLDPIGRRQVKDILKQIAADGTTVFFSSHVLGDVEDTAERVAIIDKGRLKRIATVLELTRASNRVILRLDPEVRITPDENRLRHIRAILLGINIAEVTDDAGRIVCSIESESVIPSIVEKLVNNGYKVYEVSFKRVSLEDSFIQEFGNDN
jgi:ABC-2 type transport system ATP-binding protein